MTLSFPNPSRSFDETRNAVRFTGHDGMFEVRFLVEAAALGQGGTRRDDDTAEARCLSAFDAARGSIHKAAMKAYANGRQSPAYMLTAADLRG